MPPRGEGGNCKAPRDALHGSWNRPRSYPTILLRTPRISRPRMFETDFAARRGRTQGNRRLSSRPGIGPATPRTGGDQCRRNKASGRPAHGSAGLERTHSCWDLRYSRKRDGQIGLTSTQVNALKSWDREDLLRKPFWSSVKGV